MYVKEGSLYCSVNLQARKTKRKTPTYVTNAVYYRFIVHGTLNTVYPVVIILTFPIRCINQWLFTGDRLMESDAEKESQFLYEKVLQLEKEKNDAQLQKEDALKRLLFYPCYIRIVIFC